MFKPEISVLEEADVESSDRLTDFKYEESKKGNKFKKRDAYQSKKIYRSKRKRFGNPTVIDIGPGKVIKSIEKT